VQQLLTKKDVAAHLRVTVRTVNKILAAREIKTVRLGRLVRVRAEDLEAFVASKASKVEVAAS